MQTMLGSICIL